MIVVGYSAGPFGRAALEHGIAEAIRRDTTRRNQLDPKPVLAVKPGEL